MTGDLVPFFEGTEVHVIEKDGEVWIPLPDLAAAWGIDRNTPAALIRRNPESFEGMYTGECYVTSPSGTVGYECVNERGLYLLMGKISVDRLKNRAAKETIIRFQRWVPELIQRYRKREIQQAPANIEAEINEARHLAELTGGDLRAFQAAALRKHGKPEYADALMQSIPPQIHGQQGWFNPSQLGERCGLNAREINSYLYNKGYQYPQGPVWRLQPKGEPYGEEYWFEATSGHREIRIRWRETVLTASGLIRQPAPDQLALPQSAGAPA
jgi:prophage antirepressor-like protein